MPRDAILAHLSSLAEQASRSALHGSVLRSTTDHMKEDLEMFAAGVLDLQGLLSGYQKHAHPVEVAFRHADGTLYALRRQHNIQTDQSRNILERAGLFSDIAANSAFAAITGNATASSATSLTVPTGLPTSGGASGSMAGHICYALPNNSGTGSRVYGVILSNTATVITVDQWYDPTSTTGAAGTTPNATSNFIVSSFMGPSNWMALSTDATAAGAGDVLRTADGLFADGTSGGASTERTTLGLARAFVLPTFPGSHQTQLQKTFTYTGSSGVTIAKVVLANSLAAAGSLLALDTVLSSTATVSANGDSIQVTWTIND